jgi:hypothetical protein
VENRVCVISSGDNVGIAGYITAQSGMPIIFPMSGYIHTFDQDVATCSGVEGQDVYEYCWDIYVPEAAATGYGWPTGTNCFPFV